MVDQATIGIITTERARRRRAAVVVGMRSVLVLALLLPGCGGERGTAPNSPHVTREPLKGEGFGLLAEDFDRDGHRDLAVMSHGGNKLQFFFQTSPRRFVAGPESKLVGYHPGELLPVAPEQSLYLHLAEGLNALVVYRIGPQGQFEPLSRQTERAPRHGALFHWEGWGLGLAVVPYGQDYLVIYKNFDPLRPEAAERFELPLAVDRPSLRNAERLTVADLDGDGNDEILFATVNTDEVGVIRRPADGEPPAAGGLATFPAGMQKQLAAADLDEDGHVDLVIPDVTAPFKLHLLFNDGKGRFPRSLDVDVPTTQGIFQFVAGKDRDGFLYLLGASTDNLSLYQVPRNWDTRSPLPRRTVALASPMGTHLILWRDMDGDGETDAVVGDNRGPWIIWGPLWSHFDDMQKQPLFVH